MKVLIIGYGRWGSKLAERFIELLGAENVLIADIDIERILKVPQGVLAGTDYEAMLALYHVDACVVATLPKDHAKIAGSCLAKGYPTLVEKPLALLRYEAEDLLRLAQNEKVTLMTDDTFSYHPIKIENYNSNNSIFRGVWSNPRKETSEEGIWWTQGPHPVSLMLRFFGQWPRDVSGVIGLRKVELCFRFPGGLEAYIYLNWDVEKKVRRIMLEQDGLDYATEITGEAEPLRVMAKAFLDRAIAPAPWFDEHAVRVVHLLEWAERHVAKK